MSDKKYTKALASKVEGKVTCLNCAYNYSIDCVSPYLFWISNRPKMFDSDTKCENCGEAIDSEQSLSVVDHIIEQMQANPKTNSHE